MGMKGRLDVQYGASLPGKGKSCFTANEDGKVEVTFKYKTTSHESEAQTDLANKWYHKKCAESKASKAWKNRPATAYPFTEECYMTLYDATVARDYFWDIKFTKLTDRAKKYIKYARSILKYAMIRYRSDEDDDIDIDDGDDLDPQMRIHAVLKGDDKYADVTMETSQMIRDGKKMEYKDYPMKLNWGMEKLRNLKFSGMAPRLMKMGVIKPCVATTDYVRTMDNVTYSYKPARQCWTLMSGHCAENPSYAVFTKLMGKNLAMKAYIGGHEIHIKGSTVKIDGVKTDVGSNAPQIVHKERGEEIFKIFKWGSTYNIYSFLRVWIVFDGSFVEVVPAPSIKGNHCGMCGNYNRNQYDEMMKKDGISLAKTADEMRDDYCVALA